MAGIKFRSTIPKPKVSYVFIRLRAKRNCSEEGFRRWLPEAPRKRAISLLRLCATARILAVLWIFVAGDRVGVETRRAVWDPRRYSYKPREQKRHQMERLNWWNVCFRVVGPIVVETWHL